MLTPFQCIKCRYFQWRVLLLKKLPKTFKTIGPTFQPRGNSLGKTLFRHGCALVNGDRWTKTRFDELGMWNFSGQHKDPTSAHPLGWIESPNVLFGCIDANSYRHILKSCGKSPQKSGDGIQTLAGQFCINKDRETLRKLLTNLYLLVKTSQLPLVQKHVLLRKLPENKSDWDVATVCKPSKL